jgi:F-type H+-transporting ATPase subunit g
MALASRLAQLQAKACEATRFVAKHGCAYQRSLVEKNKKYVVEPPTIEKCQELSKQLFYTRLARFVAQCVPSPSSPFCSRSVD